MSGIAGWFSEKAVDISILQNSWRLAIEKLVMPYGVNRFTPCYRSNGIFFNWKRCSLPNQSSPFMEFTGGKGTYVIVYDGRLTNTQELRCRLVKAGLNFVSDEEAEVVLKAYLYWGELCVHYLDGCFSFAIIEETAGSVFAARDSVGGKPFYYTKTKNGFLFASQIRALFASRFVKPLIDEEGFYALLFLSPAHVQGTTVFKNIFELPMGHTLTYQKSGLKIKQYWSPAAQIHEETLEETISHTRYFIREALRRQLGAAEKNLCILSPDSLGSEIIARAIEDLFFLKGSSYLSYPYGLKNMEGALLPTNLGGKLIIACPEPSYSPEEPPISPETFIQALRDFAKCADLPGMGYQDGLLNLFYQNIKHYRVTSFTPLGIDEFFGGQPWYCNRDMLSDSIFPWCRSVPLRSGIIKERYLEKSGDYIFGAYESMIAGMKTLPGEKALERRMRELFVLNLNWYLPAFLRQAEVLHRLTGVETRMPFCDQKLISYAYNIPWSMKALDGLEKGILRTAAEGFLTQEMVWKPSVWDREEGNVFFYEALETEIKNILEEKHNALSNFLNLKQIYHYFAQSKGREEPFSASRPQIFHLFAWLIQLDEWLKSNEAVFMF